jgi:hypothetical protein
VPALGGRSRAARRAPPRRAGRWWSRRTSAPLRVRGPAPAPRPRSLRPAATRWCPRPRRSGRAAGRMPGGARGSHRSMWTGRPGTTGTPSVRNMPAGALPISTRSSRSVRRAQIASQTGFSVTAELSTASTYPTRSSRPRGSSSHSSTACRTTDDTLPRSMLRRSRSCNPPDSPLDRGSPGRLVAAVGRGSTRSDLVRRGRQLRSDHRNRDIRARPRPVRRRGDPYAYHDGGPARVDSAVGRK